MNEGNPQLCVYDKPRSPHSHVIWLVPIGMRFLLLLLGLLPTVRHHCISISCLPLVYTELGWHLHRRHAHMVMHAAWQG
jgi:hypothetical protein